jgi:hypothetical protein
LLEACLIAGDETALAQKLGVPVMSVVDWLLGDTPVPNDAFLLAVDIVLAQTRKQVQENRKQIQDNWALLERIRRRHRR